MKPGLVRVILSTYNSEKFIRPLVDSVLGQSHAPLELWVRDDGSRDGTPAILTEYARRHPDRMRVVLEPNVGMVKSYFSVIQAAGREAEFTAFCDHDDVWHPEKIARALEMLRSHDGTAPLMYTGRLHIVDDQLAHLGWSNVPGRPMSFSNALVENVAAACTMVMNPAARDLLLDRELATDMLYPDWWFYLLVSAFGTVLYDPAAYVEYRRHGGNAVGSPSIWSIERLRQAWGLIHRGRFAGRLVAQAAAFRRVYGNKLPPVRRALLDEFIDRPASLLGRARVAACCGVYRQRALDGAIVRFLLLTADVPS